MSPCQVTIKHGTGWATNNSASLSTKMLVVEPRKSAGPLNIIALRSTKVEWWRGWLVRRKIIFETSQQNWLGFISVSRQAGVTALNSVLVSLHFTTMSLETTQHYQKSQIPGRSKYHLVISVMSSDWELSIFQFWSVRIHRSCFRAWWQPVAALS